MVLVQIHKDIKLAAQNAFAEAQEAIVRLRSYTTIGSDESKNALQNMRQDIDTMIMEMALYQRGFMIAKVSGVHIMYHKNKPNKSEIIY